MNGHVDNHLGWLGLDDHRDRSWMSQGVCRDQSPPLFFSDYLEPYAKAVG